MQIKGLISYRRVEQKYFWHSTTKICGYTPCECAGLKYLFYFHQTFLNKRKHL